MNTAQIIIEQLGHKTLYMLGAKDVIDTGNGVQFKIGRNAKGVTHISIELEPSDTYKVRFSKVGRKYNVTTLAELNDVYVGSLHRTIEVNTELYTRL